MGPADTGIGTGHNNILARETHRPDIRRVRIRNSRLDRLRRLRERSLDSLWLRKVILDARIAFYPRHVRSTCQCRSDRTGAFYQNGVNDIKGLMLDFALAQPLQDWFLSGPTLV